MPGKLTLHIGSHKTGTTSIQQALTDSEIRLARLGLKYLHPEGKRTPTDLVACQGIGAKFRAVIVPEHVQSLVASAGDQDAILSSERLFWVYQRRQVKLLHKILSQHFTQFEIICYLRRQDLLALSHRKQVADIANLPAQRFYGFNTRGLPDYAPHFDHFFDYATKIEMWQEVFGADRITVRRFERETLESGDVVQDFFRLINASSVCPQKNYAKNKPFNRLQIMVGMRLKQLDCPKPLARQIMTQLSTRQADVIKPSRSSAEAFLEHFQASNQRLAAILGEKQRPGFFQNDMHLYPENGNDDWHQIDPTGALDAALSGLSSLPSAKL